MSPHCLFKRCYRTRCCWFIPLLFLMLATPSLHAGSVTVDSIMTGTRGDTVTATTFVNMWFSITNTNGTGIPVYLRFKVIHAATGKVVADDIYGKKTDGSQPMYLMYQAQEYFPRVYPFAWSVRTIGEHIIRCEVYHVPDDGLIASLDRHIWARKMTVGIDITPCPSYWMPGLGNIARFTARTCYYRPDLYPGNNAFVYPGPPAVIALALGPVSRERGVCLNRGRYTATDLHFNVESNRASFDSVYSDNDTCDLTGTIHAHWSAVITKGPVTEAEVTVMAEDWAANGMISARILYSKDLDSSLYELVKLKARDQSGNPSYAFGDATAKIPLDSNGNSIADGWEGDTLGGNSSPLWDDENMPNPKAKSTGDGLTRFEEYRGVYLRDNRQHRLSPIEKELLVYSENGDSVLGLDPYVKILYVDSTGMNGAAFDGAVGSVNPARGPRVINPNGTSFHKVDQHGLWLRVAGKTDARIEWGITLNRDSTGAGPHDNFMIGPPRQHGRIDVYIDNIRAALVRDSSRQFQYASENPKRDLAPARFSYDGTKILKAVIQHVISHEILHGLGLVHHADSTYSIANAPHESDEAWLDIHECLDWPREETRCPSTLRKLWTSETRESNCVMSYFFGDIWRAVSLKFDERSRRWTSTDPTFSTLIAPLLNHGLGETCKSLGGRPCIELVTIDDADQ